MATKQLFPTDAEERLIREREHRLELEISGNRMCVDLRTIDGRMAARAYAYSIAATDPGLAKAILERVGREG